MSDLTTFWILGQKFIKIFALVFWKIEDTNKVILRLTDLVYILTICLPFGSILETSGLHIQAGEMLLTRILSLPISSAIHLVKIFIYQQTWLFTYPTTDYGRPNEVFFIEIPDFWAWANNLGIWDTFGWFVRTHLWLRYLSRFSNN